MKIKDGQDFFSFYFPKQQVCLGQGLVSPYELVHEWERKFGRDKSLGQICTPAQVGKVMARWVTSKRPTLILDPAVGVGNLLHECWLLCPKAQFIGIDRDSNTIKRAVPSVPPTSRLVCADYLKSDVGNIDGIIANPPYVKAHHQDYAESDWRFFEERFGTSLDRLTNLYALFLLKIWEDLALHGRAAVIIPSEFLNANFGTEIKERLIRSIRPAAIALFEPKVNVFEQAMTTSCILFLEKGRPSSAKIHSVKVNSVEEVERLVDDLLAEARAPLIHSRYADLSAHKPREKWLNTILAGGKRNRANGLRRKVGDYFRCLRGIATGANDYFCLTKAEIKSRSMPVENFDPCITKAPDAEGLVFSQEKFARLAAEEKRCFLLNPRRLDKTTERYLKEGEETGVSKRYLPSHRPIWYLPENRPPAEIWVAVFSRESVKYILNAAAVRNLTCFHGLYCREKLAENAVLMTLFLNSSLGREAFFAVNRFYGDGLNKLEPKDVEEMPCPELPKINKRISDELVEKLFAIELLSAGKRQAAIDSLAATLLSIKAPVSQLVAVHPRQPCRQRSSHQRASAPKIVAAEMP